MKRFQVSFWVGLVAVCGLLGAARELSFMNWHPIVAPIDLQPLVLRQDARGDGRFQAPRSGHRTHRGIDLAAAVGTPVRTVRSGTVVKVGHHRGLGHYVELKHRGKVRSLYAHLQKAVVEPGARVRQGAIIGTVGKSGNAKHPWITPHLHLEILRDGTPVDPQRLGLKIVNPSQEVLVNASDSD